LLAIREVLEWLVRHVIVEPMPEHLSRGANPSSILRSADIAS